MSKYIKTTRELIVRGLSRSRALALVGTSFGLSPAETDILARMVP